MSLRRSARLSTLPNQALSLPTQPQKQSQAQVNGIAKPRKSTTKTKAKAWRPPKTPVSSVSELIEPFGPKPNLTPSASASATDNYWDNPFPTDSRLHSTPPPLDRPVEPHRTNATLLTPHGSSLVAYPPGAEDISPSKTGLPRPTATTGTLLDKAVAHLIATDPRLQPLIEKHPCSLFSPAGLAEEIDPFRSLVQSIIGQQVSGAAAKSIRDKFVGLFNASETDSVLRSKRFPAPEEIVKFDVPTLRTAGLSQRKAEYILGLSEKFVNKELSAAMLLNASDQELVEKLTAVRGLGQWSVEMFACFALKRFDVFSTGDLGVQ